MKTSRQGNNFGIAGMAIALLAHHFRPDTGNGMDSGRHDWRRDWHPHGEKAEMTENPERVAILHTVSWAWRRYCWLFNSYLSVPMTPVWRRCW